MLVIGILTVLLVCFGIPAGGMLLRRRGKGRGRAFWLGALAFTVSQMVLRIPALNYLLPKFGWYTILQMQPWQYGLFLGLTAGLFEETARWVVMRFLLKRRWDWEDGVAFGLGHGGIEAVLIVGINYLVLLGMVFAGNGALISAPPQMMLMAAWERLFTIGFHVGASLLVMYGVQNGRDGWYLLLAVALHTISDAAIVILPRVFLVGSLGIEAYITVISLVTLALGIMLYRKSIVGKRS